MIFIDSNVPMYLVGAEHPNKAAAVRALDMCIARNERIVSSAEVIQEILHRYMNIKRYDAMQPCINALLGVCDEVLPIEMQDVLAAKDILIGLGSLSARDALHVAVMKRHRIARVMSFDAGFDSVEWIERVS